jgi:hypothetical protein
MLQDRAVRVDDETDIEETVGPVLVPRLGLRHDEHAPIARQTAEAVGLRAGDIDRAGARKFGVIDIENLVVEPLQRPSGIATRRTGISRLESQNAAFVRLSRCSRFFSMSSRRRMPQKLGINPTAV